MQSAVLDLSFAEFDHLSIYMHLTGTPNTFGDPGICLRINRRENELIARCVLDGADYMALGGADWTPKLNAIVDATARTVAAVLTKYKRTEEVDLYMALIEEAKL